MMSASYFALLVLTIVGLVHCGEPEVECSAPRSPDHGQAFLYQEGRVVKYVCEPGYVLSGKDMMRCVEGQWEAPPPECLEMKADGTVEESESDSDDVGPSDARPLFSWGPEPDDEEMNETDADELVKDDPRVHLLMYPQRRARIVTSRIQTGRLRSSSELEDEEKRRSHEDKRAETTIHFGDPSPVMFARRTVASGKSRSTPAVHMTVNNGRDVQVIAVPRAAVTSDEKGTQSDDALRQMYWYAYHYPQYASMIQYRNGAPVVMTLTESQLAWINSLHPELRDQYLKGIYVVRAEEAAEGARAHAMLRSYEDYYNYAYHAPYYRHSAALVEDPVSSYDYSCHESGYPFVKAPRLRNMHIQRYDRRQNSNRPYQHYLAAVYRCNPGYIMLDTRFTELYCSKKGWIGNRPVCVRRG